MASSAAHLSGRRACCPMPMKGGGAGSFACPGFGGGGGGGGGAGSFGRPDFGGGGGGCGAFAN